MNEPPIVNLIQHAFDGMSAQWQRERAATQMTLGGLIQRLKELPAETPVNLELPHSYRGYYSDLAFQRGQSTAGELLAVAQSCMGEVFTGYKGGDFQMGRNTPLWVASYGCCGEKLIGINQDGSLDTIKEAP